MPAGALTTVQTDKLKPYLDAIKNSIPDNADRVMAVAAGCPIMVCHGADGCVYNDTCPFVTGALISQRPPEGDHCPVEIAYFFEFYKGYRNEINPEGTNFSLMSLIKEMCVLELQLMRAERLLATDGAIVELVAVGVDKSSGTVIDKPEMSAKAHTWRLLLKEKLRFFDQMGLTPKSKAALGSTASKDPSTFAAELISHAEKIWRERDTKRRQEISDARPNGKALLPPPQQGTGDDDQSSGWDNAVDVIPIGPDRSESDTGTESVDQECAGSGECETEHRDTGGVSGEGFDGDEPGCEGTDETDDDRKPRNHGSAAPF